MEKKWFIHCDLWSQGRRAVLYSLPYICDRLTISTNSFNERISGCLNGIDNTISRNIYKNVKTLMCQSFSWNKSP